MASLLKHYQGIKQVTVIGNYLPCQCGITTFTTDLNEGQSVQAREMNIWDAAMNDKPEVYLSAQAGRHPNDFLMVKYAANIAVDTHFGPDLKQLVDLQGFATMMV